MFDNYPDPFTTKTKILLKLGSVSPGAAFSIYDISGRLVRQWQVTTPVFPVCWDGTDFAGTPLAAGVYFYAVTNGAERFTKTARLIR